MPRRSLIDLFEEDKGKGFENMRSDIGKGKTISFEGLVKYLKDNKITPTEALRIIQKERDTSKTSGPKIHWKLMRFQLYLWARSDEEGRTKTLGKRIDTIRTLVRTQKYRKLFENYPKTITGGSFNHIKEAKKLADLVSEPRQKKWFRKGLYVFENTNTLMQQSHIDKYR